MPYKDPEAGRRYRAERYQRKRAELLAWQRDYYRDHKPESLAAGRKHRKDRPDLHKVYNKRAKLKERYGTSLEWFEAQLKAQDGLCAICRNPFKGAKDTHVDHCHATGRIRGLLCNSCNLGLGQFKDNVDFLRRSIEYLEKEGAA